MDRLQIGKTTDRWSIAADAIVPTDAATIDIRPEGLDTIMEAPRHEILTAKAKVATVKLLGA